jgi:DUF4097 and DUF4098 domain-containing protein YvlB
MKLALVLLLTGSVTLFAQTEERTQKQFSVRPGGKLILQVPFGSVEVSTNSANQVTVDAYRKVSRRTKAEEADFLREYPVTFSQNGDVVTVESPRERAVKQLWRGRQRNEARYTITVPSDFDTQIRTAGGTITVRNLTGKCEATTSGGNLTLTGLNGPLRGSTSGGRIQVADCTGKIHVRTSGGGIELSGGSGDLDASTSGGSIKVSDFQGPAHVSTSGGGITLENVTGAIHGSTSGGSISGTFTSAVRAPVQLKTSGGGITFRAPAQSAFDLDASTSGGGVSSELPVTVVGKAGRAHLQGSVNGGGKTVLLRTSGGSIRVLKN